MASAKGSSSSSRDDDRTASSGVESDGTNAADAQPTGTKRGPRGPYNVVRVNRKAQTFRLPPDVFELIRAAREDAAERGDRLTNDDAVIQAVRSYWGRRLPTRD